MASVGGSVAKNVAGTFASAGNLDAASVSKNKVVFITMGRSPTRYRPHLGFRLVDITLLSYRSTFDPEGTMLGVILCMAIWAHRKDEEDRKALEAADEADAEVEVSQRWLGRLGRKGARGGTVTTPTV